MRLSFLFVLPLAKSDTALATARPARAKGDSRARLRQPGAERYLCGELYTRTYRPFQPTCCADDDLHLLDLGAAPGAQHHQPAHRACSVSDGRSNARVIARRWKHLGRERLEMLIGGPLES